MTVYHILVVDDDILASGVLKEHLEHEGYRVTLAYGCKEAKETLAGTTKIDLMILDYLMPDGHGTDLIRCMAEEPTLQKPNIIMCSSLIDPANPAWKALCSRIPFGLQSLIRAYIGKPYTFNEMAPVIQMILKPDASAAPIEFQTGDYRPAEPEVPAPETDPLREPDLK